MVYVVPLVDPSTDSVSVRVAQVAGGGSSSVAFDYRIMAKRKGFENIRMADKTKEFSPANRPTKRPAGSHAPNPDEFRKEQLQRSQELAKKKVVTTAAVVKK